MNKPLQCFLLLLSAMSPTMASGNIPYGIEFVAGMRDEYHQRGLQLADDLIDLQIQSNITLTKSSSLNLAAWQGAEMAGDFQEAGVLLSLTKEYSRFALNSEIGYTRYENSFVESGIQYSVGVDYSLASELVAYVSATYDDDQSSMIGLFGLLSSARITDDSFMEYKVEAHMANDYYSREGLYDLSSRVSYTLNVNEMLSFTPFVSYTYPLDEVDLDPEFSTGVWVELFF